MIRYFLCMAAVIVTVMAIDTLAAAATGMLEPRDMRYALVGGGR